MNDEVKKEKNSTKAILQFVLVVCFLVVMFALSQNIGKEKKIFETEKAEVSSVIVEVVDVASRAEQLKITTTGTVQVRNNIDIVPQVAGRIDEVYEGFKDGGMFEADVPLFRVEQEDFKLQVNRLRANVEQAQTALALQEAEAISAIEEWETLNPGRPLPDLVARKPQMDEAQAQLKSARSQLATAQLDVKRTQYKLPFAGRVVRTSVEVGQYVQPGQSYGTVYARDALEVTVPIRDTLLQWFDVETSQAVISTRYRGQEILMKGKVSRISGELDAETRFANLIIVPTEESEWIKLVPGVFVDVTLVGPNINNLWRVPNDTLQEGQKLWSVTQDNRLKVLTPKILDIGKEETLIIGDGQTVRLARGMIDGASEGLEVRIFGNEKPEGQE